MFAYIQYFFTFIDTFATVLLRSFTASQNLNTKRLNPLQARNCQIDNT